jgi:hypothetical protein
MAELHQKEPSWKLLKKYNKNKKKDYHGTHEREHETHEKRKKY